MDFRSSSGRWLAVVGVALVLGGCGGGLAFGYCDDCDNQPPAVSIASAADTVEAGQEVRLVAAASDESGIDDVTFYRRESTGSVVLGSDGSAPYVWTLTAPEDGSTSIEVFARARDDEGNRADSASITITVTPPPSEAERAQTAASTRRISPP